MNFMIDQAPPSTDELARERQQIADEIRRISTRDTIITFVLIIISSIVLGMVVYWTTGSMAYAGVAGSLFPVLGIVMSLIGITKAAGFRSAAQQLTDMKNSYIALTPISAESEKDVIKLCSKYKVVNDYHEKILQRDRNPVNGELAMFWEYDTSTLAKTARGREFLDRAKGTVGNS